MLLKPFCFVVCVFLKIINGANGIQTMNHSVNNYQNDRIGGDRMVHETINRMKSFMDNILSVHQPDKLETAIVVLVLGV